MSKRAIDIVISVLALVILAPLILVIALLVMIFLGRPVFFAQKRPGLNGQIFTLYKFRTMTTAVAADGRELSDAERLHWFGHLLRVSSLDELPELLNVIRGEMSLVGPRPLLVEYLPLYNQVQMRRHEVRPGITGWAQVNGRNAISWEQKFEHDIWYVENKSIFLDFKILLMTVKKVFIREGIASEDCVSAEKFTGSSK